MDKIITADGSITYRDLDLDECYHTQSGALTEALEKHVVPSGMLEFVKTKNEISIGDVCYGLGYNSLIALNKIWKVNPSCKIHLSIFENDLVIMKELENISLTPELEEVKKKLLRIVNEGSYEDSTLIGKLYLGDFRLMLEGNFDVVFFDPFSPGKVPELWSLEVFQKLYSCCAKGCVITTYSCARRVRDGLKGAGFVVEDGPCIGRRSPSTIARKP